MTRITIIFNMVFSILLLASAFISALNAMPERIAYPHVIAHRGASGYIPEHSLQAYQLAIDLLTDYIEPDLCLSKDGVFVAMHDLLLDDTTNVASYPEFADRRTTKVVEGSAMTGFFVDDFSYAELQKLRLKQRLEGRSTLFDGLFTIPSLSEIMGESFSRSLAQSSYSKTNRTVGIYVELKHPDYFNAKGFHMEEQLVAALADGGYAVAGPAVGSNLSNVLPVVIQCFSAPALQHLRTLTSIPLVLLLESGNLTNLDLSAVAAYAKAVGPEKTALGSMPSSLGKQIVDGIHQAGLLLHPWTFRADRGVLPRFDGDFEQEEMYFYCCLGVDGLFSEFPDRSRATISLMKAMYVAQPGDDGTRCAIDCAHP